jgi:hypothetical protein
MKTKITSMFNSSREGALDLARKVSLAMTAPTEKQARLILFSAGIVALGIGLSADVLAQTGGLGARGGNIDDQRIARAVNTLFKFLEGSFGALIMAAAGIGAIVSASFGQFKAALSCMVVAVGAFILRSMMNTFFNIESLQADGTMYDGEL